jgi:hypothetical protein
MTQLMPGATVERLPASDRYIVPPGTKGRVVQCIMRPGGDSGGGYLVRWDGREVNDFAAGSRLRATGSVEGEADKSVR